jgi:alkylation response protein AidB-like acyl-CoA dehydrogenase/aminoglycoside phosphotransferase (APT) family kinase protein
LAPKTNEKRGAKQTLVGSPIQGPAVSALGTTIGDPNQHAPDFAAPGGECHVAPTASPICDNSSTVAKTRSPNWIQYYTTLLISKSNNRRKYRNEYVFRPKVVVGHCEFLQQVSFQINFYTPLQPTIILNMKLAQMQEALRVYLAERTGVVPQGSLQVHKFSHGQSNPTYLLTIVTTSGSHKKYVLRKKPPPPTLPSAHAIEREFQVLCALAPTPVPVPSAIHLCEDTSVIGTEFYIMSYVQGRIFQDPSLPEIKEPSERTAVYRAMAITLATLHSVPPAKVGLERYGPLSHYNARQIARWSKQYRSCLKNDLSTSQRSWAVPMQQLEGLLRSQSIPPADSDLNSTICHGDFRLDNLVFDATRSDTVLAILDWELSTLGDPLADLAYCCLAYRLGTNPTPGLPSLPPHGHLPDGIPTEAEFVQMYCSARGVPLPDPATWHFALALSLFRLASILAGVGARSRAGNASSTIAAAVGSDAVVLHLATTALNILGTTETEHLPGRGSLVVDKSGRLDTILGDLVNFMETKIYPAEAQLNAHAQSSARWTIHPLQEALKCQAKAAGLWNLWIPPAMGASLREWLEGLGTSETVILGPGLSNWEYAHCAAIMGRSVWASECFNCSAPDTGNMEVLAKYGSKEQKDRWLLPLLKGDIRSCFAMTEPSVASSDATNIQGCIQVDGDSDDDNAMLVINGVKWWISGATDPRCKVAIFMGRDACSLSNANSDSKRRHAQQSMVLVPMDAQGVKVIRPLTVFGYDDAPHGHAEMVFENVRVPRSASLILGHGRGFEIAQGRLGPGRLHHCMRVVGAAERALELAVARVTQRRAFGKTLHGHQSVRTDLAKARIELDAARLVVLDAAMELDASGLDVKRAAAKIAAAKYLAPNTALRVIDRVIQVHGGLGVSGDSPLAAMWAGTRTLRLADGPDAVHLETVAKSLWPKRSRL